MESRILALEERVSAIEKYCSELNSNINSLRGIVSAFQNGDYITSVSPITEGGMTIGYIISFANGNPVTLYHGRNGANGKDGRDGANGNTPLIGVKQDTDGIWYWTIDGEWLIDADNQKVKAVGIDGKDGADGKDGLTPQLKIDDGYWYVSIDDGQTWVNLGKAIGENGKDGRDGANGNTPLIGVKQDTDGIWYWTIDGKWLIDADNQKVKAVGIDGKDGADGKDGLTPQLKIEDGYWYVSIDNAHTWDTLGKATGENGKDGDSMFQDIIVTDRIVTFVLVDGQSFVVRRASDLSISFDTDDLVVMQANSLRDIHYTISSASDDITIEVLGSGDVKAKVVRTDERTGYIQVKTGDIIDEYSKVLIMVTNGDKIIIKALSFERASIEVIESITKRINVNGGLLTLDFFSNVAYQVEIPDDAKTWISIVPETKTMVKHSIMLDIKKNCGIPRSSIVKVRSTDGDNDLFLSFLISQDGYISPEKYFQNENAAVHKYMTEVEYSDFSVSKVKEYAVESGYRMDWPNSFSFPPQKNALTEEDLEFRLLQCWSDSIIFQGRVSLEQAEDLISSLMPSIPYIYEINKLKGENILRDTLLIDGQLRMIKTKKTSNIRDLGGWKTNDGRRVKYGRIFRGGAFRKSISDDDVTLFVDQLGISVEIDLRSESELLLDDDNPNNDLNYSLFGDNILYYHYPMPLSNFINENDAYVKVFRTVLSSLQQGRNVYIHCAGGADRTGTIIHMLEAILGVTDSNIAKDYELTSFAPLYYDKDNFRLCNNCAKTNDHFSSVSGQTGTANEIATSFLLSQGITQDEIDSFRNIMLESYY